MAKKLSKHNERLHRESLPQARRAASLRRNGITWEEVGEIMGITRQRAQQLAAKVTK